MNEQIRRSQISLVDRVEFGVRSHGANVVARALVANAAHCPDWTASGVIVTPRLLLSTHTNFA